MGAIQYFGELKAAAKCLKVHRGAGKSFFDILPHDVLKCLSILWYDHTMGRL